MTRRLAGVFACLSCTMLGTGVARADAEVGEASGEVAESTDAASTIEVGAFGGGFISNYFHQFYDIKIPDRQELERVSSMVGLRLAYFPRAWFGAELEGAWTMATTKVTKDGASILGARLQAVLQRRIATRVVPFATVGVGLAHLRSDDTVLGSDTDMLVHLGAGVRVFVTPSIAVRAEGRFLRGPSQQAPYHLNASYGEVLLGVSFVPRKGGRTRVETLDLAAAPVDRDGDGIFEPSDKCPDVAEDRDLFQDDDGCPDLDNDGDGIADVSDRCAMDPEDRDGFEDGDGCPDHDNDGDGVKDAQDGCPNAAEDRDGYRDSDGCPDEDNDEDGLLDVSDKCPSEPETINGVDDNDGCPDVGDASVVLSPDRLELFSPIAFKGAKLTKPSIEVLGQVGATLRRYRQILRLRVTVHVHPTRDPSKDQALSDARGIAVRDWLVAWGIDSKRIEVRGFGSTKPLVKPTQRNAAEVNDRVELIILERK